MDQAFLWYDRIRQTGLENLVLKVASDDPQVLAWPWEALCDPHGATLAQTCRLERQLSQLHDPLPLPAGLPDSAINILLVIARPYGDADVGFHAVSGPLVDWARESKLAVHIEVLRPPTFAALQQQLAAKRGHYHIVHFDGHGGYGEPSGASAHSFHATQGHLVFEDAVGEEDLISAEKLTTLLSEHRIPIMVLNACQSARIDAQAEDPFASTAAALLKAGIRSVVAMGYNLYVSGAQQFVPAFYRRLLESGNVAEATRAGRKAMLECDARQTPRGEYPLRDWVVPVLYQQESVPLSVRPRAEAAALEVPEAATELGDYGFIGRQDAIQRLERALLRQPAAAILIHGMAGIGKTTLARGFVRWLEHTAGLGREDAAFIAVRWFAFDDIRSGEYVVNDLVAACFGTNAMAAPLEQKLPALIKTLREQPRLLIWDNFESTAGIEGTEVAPLMIEADRQLLKGLLQRLRGGRTKVLITSRSAEDWLTPQEAYRLPLVGLRGEDAWTYCNAVVRDLGLRVQRADSDIVALLQELDGHPLALRSVLLRLAEVPARQLLAQLRQAFAGHAGDDSTRRIFAALSLLDGGLPQSFGPVLELIGLHQRCVDVGHVVRMMSLADPDARHEVLRQCFGALERGGLLHHVGNGAYSMHPAVHGFLASAHPPQEVAVQRFVDFMARYANQLAPSELHEQRGHFALHGANFQQALSLSVQQADSRLAPALMQSLAVFALNSRDFATATRLFETLATQRPELESTAYHQLGRVAEEQRDFAAAENWYQKSLAIELQRGDEHGAACTYSQLGSIAKEQRAFAAAECWYQKSLAIEEQHGNAHGAAITYYQLGMIAQEQRDFAAAERWYQKSLAIEEWQDDAHAAAITYHQLGAIAQVQRDFAAAERWYQKSLAIKEQQRDEHGAAITYLALGMIAQEQGDFTAAERWCQRALAIEEKQGNDYVAANIYHQLGIIAQEQRDLAAAERWYQKSLAIKEQQRDEHGAAMSYHQLGMIAQEQRDFAAAGRWYQKALAIKEHQGNEHGASITYAGLASLAHEQGEFAVAGDWLFKAIGAFARQKDTHFLRSSVARFLVLLRTVPAELQAALRARWQAMGFDEVGRLDDLERSFNE